MKTLISLWAGLSMAALMALPLAYSQQGPGPGPRGLMYNPATETTIEGTVEQVKTVSGRRGWNGTHLLIKTGEKTLDVHLGPESFLKEKDFRVVQGDQVKVTGSSVSTKNGEAIIARKVKKGGETLVLRNEQGVPLWSRGRRR